MIYLGETKKKCSRDEEEVISQQIKNEKWICTIWTYLGHFPSRVSRAFPLRLIL